MGHADIETTMNIYAEATAQKKQESFAQLEGKIKIQSNSFVKQFVSIPLTSFLKWETTWSNARKC